MEQHTEILQNIMFSFMNHHEFQGSDKCMFIVCTSREKYTLTCLMSKKLTMYFDYNIYWLLTGWYVCSFRRKCQKSILKTKDALCFFLLLCSPLQKSSWTGLDNTATGLVLKLSRYLLYWAVYVKSEIDKHGFTDIILNGKLN